MTKKELSQLRYLSSEIELLRKQIEEADDTLENAADVVSGSNSEWPYEPRKFFLEGAVVSTYTDKIRRLKHKLERRTEELMDKREELENYIATVPDSLIRQILTLRYVNGLSWAQVAAHIGGGNTADSVRMAHNRFLREN